MRYNNYLLLFSILFIYFQNSTGQNSGKYQYNGKLTIYDSIIVQASNIAIYDYYEKKGLFLGTNYHSKDIVIFDKKGHIKYSFNSLGDGPKEYRQTNIIISKFFTYNSVVVLSKNAFVNYSFDGNFIKVIKLDDENSALFRKNVNIFINNSGDSCTIYSADQYTSHRSINVDFYNDTSYKFFYFINFNKNVKRRIITYEKNSIYRNNEFYYPEVRPKAYVNSTKGILYVLFPHDTKLFEYDINNNFQLFSVLDLKPDFFGHLNGINYGKKPEMPMPFILSNSLYSNLSTLGDTIITTYNQKMKEDEIFTSLEEANENMELIRKYIQIFIKNKKMCEDIRIPQNVSGIAYTLSKNEIFFKKVPNQYDEMNNTATFYIGKIELR